ncbi:MAG: DUF1028 domain-containing protein [Ignavibacteriales bacterium]|nr:DUF1028 domain-containing protein [Ignavibacteriales bacterium]MBI3788687.1 DUF1028 domain-containing protein [Ignavibacteriales bacterium]
MTRSLQGVLVAVVFLSFVVLVSKRTHEAQRLAVSKDPFASTFSIVGIDPENGDVGVAVQSKFPNVRPIVPWAEAGVGAIATQSFVNVQYGPKGLTLMRNGATAEEALRILTVNDSARETRQVGIIDAKGNSASWTGKECFDWAGGITGQNSGGKGMIITGKGFSAQGNTLVGKETVEALAKTFTETKGSLADKLVAAIIAGGKAGGDRRGEESAALLVKRKGAGYDGTTDNYIDISIYDHPKPLAELDRLYKLHKLYYFRTDPKNLIKIDAALCKELQGILSNKVYKGFEFYAGPVNGIFDAKTKKALQDFMGWENYDVRIRDDDQIDKEVLDDIRRNYSEWKASKK